MVNSVEEIKAVSVIGFAKAKALGKEAKAVGILATLLKAEPGLDISIAWEMVLEDLNKE